MPSRNDDGEWWTMLTSAGLWEGADDLQVFCEFVDIMFQTLTAGHIEWDMRPLFADRRDEKVDCCTRAITMLGEEMERHPFGDCLGGYHQELSGPGHKAALGSFYTPESLCKMCAGITIDVDEARAKAARGETVTICDPACGSGRLPLAVAEMLADVRHDLRMLFIVFIKALRTKNNGGRCFAVFAEQPSRPERGRDVHQGFWFK